MQHWFEKHRELQARRAEEGFDGFTLIELLIVIVVLGILAAVVIFALSGVTGQSKQSACNADAKSVEVAVEAYRNSPLNTSNAWPVTMGDLTAPTFGGDPFLRTAPGTGNGYTVTVHSTGGVGDGKVYVAIGAAAGADYDTQTANTICNSPSL
jgi:general secretion pathway protein G